MRRESRDQQGRVLRDVVFIHPSDEHYGADRVILDIVESLPEEVRTRAEFWLPTDLPHGSAPLCRELQRRGAAVRHLDLPILRRAYFRPSGILGLLGRSWRIFRALRRRRPYMVYCTTSAAFLSAPIARAAGVPNVIGHLQELWSRADRLVLIVIARACRRLVAISGPVRDQLPTSLRSRCTVVLNGTREPCDVESLDGRTGELHFLVASRWNGWKGHATLLEAWDRIEPPGILTILGGPPASGEATDVPTLRANLRRPDTVRIVGEVSDIGPYLQRADVVLVPSDAPEPFGLVAIEAFAHGRPVVGSSGGGLADIVTHGEDGWLFPRRDADALAQVLTRLTRATVNRAGVRARATYEERFTSERYAHEWLELVQPPG